MSSGSSIATASGATSPPSRSASASTPGRSSRATSGAAKHSATPSSAIRRTPLRVLAEGDPRYAAELRRLEDKVARLARELFQDLTPWQRVQISRHPRRPFFSDYLERVFDDFVELHGDRTFGDDAAVVGGLARY